MRSRLLGLSALFTLVALPAAAGPATLVDCSNADFQSSTSARSLFGWSIPLHEEAVAASRAGSGPASACDKLLRQRGAAHCSEPGNDEYRAGLEASLAACQPAGGAERPATPPPPPASTPAPAPASTGALVDCSQPAFQSSSSAMSLYGWSSPLYEEAEISLRRDGVFPAATCEELLSKRGAAHCKEPDNAEFRSGLQASLALCTRTQTETPSDVDCSPYPNEETAHRTLLNWARSAISTLPEEPTERVDARCSEVESYAVRAVCQLPDSTDARDLLSRVRTQCADERSVRKEAAEKAAQQQAEWRAKQASERVLTTPPQSQFTGGNRSQVEAQMLRALVASRVAKSSDEVVRVQAQSGWQTGRFTDTKLTYRKATGLVVWKSKRGDDVCRYTSYNFLQTEAGGSWGSLGFRSFCNGCAEGWMRCP